MTHIRKIPTGKKRGNYFYKDDRIQKSETLCGAEPGPRDVPDTKSGLDWVLDHRGCRTSVRPGSEGCKECARLARWAK